VADEREQKAGTTEPIETGDDAQRALAESGGEADRDAGAEGEKERTDWKALALTYKAKVEAANVMEQRLAEVEQELRAAKQSPTPDPQASKEADELLSLQRDLLEAEADAERFRESDPALARASRLAATSLRAQLRAAELQAQTTREQQLERINDRFIATAEVLGEDGEMRPMTKDERKRFDDFFEQNKRLFGGAREAAFDAWDGRRLREQARELAKQTRRTKDDETRRTEGVIRTHERDVTAPEVRARKFASEEAFNNEVRRLEESDPAAAWALKKARRAGTAVVR